MMCSASEYCLWLLMSLVCDVFCERILSLVTDEVEVMMCSASEDCLWLLMSLVYDVFRERILPLVTDEFGL